MSASEETLRLLRSIDASLKQLVKQSAAPPEVADDRDLDSKYGDPIVKFLPRDWTGDSFKGRHFSECPPALLDMLAETFDYFARKAEETSETYNGKPTAPYKRKDAARARGWAKRLRSGWRSASPTDVSGFEDVTDEPAGVGADAGGGVWATDDDIPF